MFWLKNVSTCPPQQYWYRQTEGIAMTFEPWPNIPELADRIAAFRAANGLPRANSRDAYFDVVQFTCTRLNNSPEWCYDADADPATLIPNTATNCGSCGAVVK